MQASCCFSLLSGLMCVSMHMCDAHSLAGGNLITCKLLVTQLLKKNMSEGTVLNAPAGVTAQQENNVSGKRPHPQRCPSGDCIVLTYKMGAQQVCDESRTKQAPDFSSSHFINSSSLMLVLEDLVALTELN